MGIYLSHSSIKDLRNQIENEGGFQIALAPMQPATFIEVGKVTNGIYQQLIGQNYTVFVDDRGQRPKDMFEVIEFLNIRHRIVISARSLSVGVFEYKDLHTSDFKKVKLNDCLDFFKNRINT